MPIIDVVTRWNSTLDMIDRFLTLNTELYAALTKMKVSVCFEIVSTPYPNPTNVIITKEVYCWLQYNGLKP